MSKVIINATNLHVGGGVQVATSFIYSLYKMNCKDITIACSTTVLSNLPKDFEQSLFKDFIVLDVHGFSGFFNKKIERIFSGYDVCFTIFGPFYARVRSQKHICGFAQAWIAYPNNGVYSRLSAADSLKNKLKFSIQNIFFKYYDKLVVEQEHVKNALINRGYNGSSISVVSNCVSTIYDEKSQWAQMDFNYSELKYDITLGFIGRPYVHKNIEILEEVNRILINHFGFNVNFLFTFSELEMRALGFDKVDNFHTVGAINVNQCPNFYKSIDALVFPSLLECFSVSPIEALKTNTTVIASNYLFVREVCKDAAFYFDATDSQDIAKVINNAFLNQDMRNEKKLMGTKIVEELPTAKDRATSYLDIIYKVYDEIGN